MSVYGGFARRTTEGSYNRALYNVLCLLQHKVLASLSGGTIKDEAVEKFDDGLLERYFTKFYQRLFSLEDDKHLPSKYSCALKELAMHYGIFEKLPDKRCGCNNSSTTSSTANLSFINTQNNTVRPSTAAAFARVTPKPLFVSAGPRPTPQRYYC